MLGLLAKSHFAFFLIPILTLAIEPTNPTGLCDRLVTEIEKTQCLKMTTPGKLDWYAASTCALYQEDKNFLGCLEQIKQASFNPQALELCARSSELTDEARSSCLQKIKNKDYSLKQLKKCAESPSHAAIETCLASHPKTRAPASPQPQGFQPL